MKSRLRFLLELVIDFNINHPECEGVFHLDHGCVDVYVMDRNGKDLMVDISQLDELTEEKVYLIYKKLNDIKFSDTKQEADTTDGE